MILYFKPFSYMFSNPQEIDIVFVCSENGVQASATVLITLIFCVFWCYLHCFQYLICIIQNNFLLFSSSMCINSSIEHLSFKCFKVVAFLDKTLYDDYLCWWLRTSIKISEWRKGGNRAKRWKSRKRR